MTVRVTQLSEGEALSYAIPSSFLHMMRRYILLHRLLIWVVISIMAVSAAILPTKATWPLVSMYPLADMMHPLTDQCKAEFS